MPASDLLDFRPDHAFDQARRLARGIIGSNEEPRRRNGVSYVALRARRRARQPGILTEECLYICARERQSLAGSDPLRFGR